MALAAGAALVGALPVADGAAVTGAGSADELLGSEFVGATAAGAAAAGRDSVAVARSPPEVFFVPWNHVHPATPTATSATKSEINPSVAPRFRERSWLSVIVTGSSTAASALSSHLFLMTAPFSEFSGDSHSRGIGHQVSCQSLGGRPISHSGTIK